MTDQRLKLQTALCSPNQGASGQRVLSKCWKVVQIAVVGLICRRIAVLIALVVLIAVLIAGQRCKSNLGLLVTKPFQIGLSVNIDGNINEEDYPDDVKES